MRVLDVPNLGFESALVTVKGERILLLAKELEEDRRVGYMLGAMARLDR